MDESFAVAAAVFADQVSAIPPDAWSGPGLGAWDLRSLVGHASRSLITVDTYLDRPADREDLDSPEAYYASLVPSAADAAAVVERGRQAGIALGDDPVAAVWALVERVLPRVRSAGDPVIETIAGGMRLSHYLPTRTFELVVHGLDIARALDVDAPRWPPEVLAEATTLAARAAVRRGSAVELLLAMTGRAGLPESFSVV